MTELLKLDEQGPINLQFKAISQGKIIYEKDYVSTCDYIEKVINIYQDYAIKLHNFYREYDESLKEAYSKESI